MSPWLDLRVPPKAVKLPLVEAQTHRRFLKTHLPVDALVFSPKAKYLYIGRDGRDVVWSMYNHHANANALWYEALNDTPGLVGDADRTAPGLGRRVLPRLAGARWPPVLAVLGERALLVGDPRPAQRACSCISSALKDDMPGEIRRIAAFLEIPIDEATWEAILEHCSFDYMKANATASVPLGGAFWDGGAETFIHKGDQRPLARRAERGGQRRLRAPRDRRARTRGGGLAAYRKPLSRRPEHP